MSWYRQYRPTTVAGLHLQSVRQSLSEMLASGSIPHALLLTGPKGTGKTSTARILAAVLNDPQNLEVVKQGMTGKKKTTLSFHEPDPDAEIVKRIFQGSSTVVFELDAASNRGIDDIRLLKERVMLPPAEGVVSVYILDEVHMLTIEAFNALLKLLEEPPEHAVFILATTELHKVPETIVSRCRVIQFQKASVAEITTSLANIADAEKLTYEKPSLELIAEHADGSFRDAVKVLETLASTHEALTQAKTEEYLQWSAKLAAPELLKLILAKDERKAVEFFELLRKNDSDVLFFYRRLLQYLHNDLLRLLGVENTASAPSVPTVLTLKQVQFFLAQFNSLSITANEQLPFLTLELKTLELILRAKEKPPAENKPASGAKSPPSVSAGARLQAEASLDPEIMNMLSSEDSEVDAESTLASFTSSEAPARPVVTFHEGVVIETLQNVEPVAVLEATPRLDRVIPPLGVTHPEAASITNPGSGEHLLAHWEEFLAQVKQKNSSIEALLRSSRPVTGETGKARIEVFYQFHKETLQQPKFMAMIDECVAVVAGGRVRFEVDLAQQAKAGGNLSTVSGQVNQEDGLIQLAKEILV